jgi:hypothetical protein
MLCWSHIPEEQHFRRSRALQILIVVARGLLNVVRDGEGDGTKYSLA